MPFWEFIGATMAGKALVKARIFCPSIYLACMQAPPQSPESLHDARLCTACHTYQSKPRMHPFRLSQCAAQVHQVCGTAPFEPLLYA